MAEDQPLDQGAEEFATPDRADIPGLAAAHTEMLEATDDDAVWAVAGMQHVLLTIKGRKSGIERKTPLPYWLDANGHRIVVGSFAGAEKHPAWFINLRDAEANPTVGVLERKERWDSSPEVLEGDDYETCWAGLTADRAFYLDYQAKTDRQIPLIRIPK